MNNMKNAQVPALPAYYTVLCTRAADAIEAIEQANYGLARELLIKGMQEAEEIVISQES